MSGFQNGLAIAGDMISAASFLGISAMMFSISKESALAAASTCLFVLLWSSGVWWRRGCATLASLMS